MKNLNKEYFPYLIFPEFIKEKWTFLPLKRIAIIRSERAGEKKCILLSVSSGIGLVSQKEKFGREIAGKQYEKYFLVRENDFVYNKSSTKLFPQGTINLYSNKELAAVPSSIFICFYVNFNIINVFYLKYLFEFNIHGKWLKNFITTGARAHGSFNIDSKDFLSIPIPIPLGEKSLAEQQKIADCLSSLDELIEVHEQKLDALKQHKKGLIQRLFPAEGETTPRWRFPEFQNDIKWKGYIISDICSVSTGKSNTQDKVANGVYPFYVRSATIERSTKYLYEEEAVITVGDGVGTGKIYHYINGKYDLHQRCYRLFNFKNILGKFLFYFFSKNFYKRFSKMTAKNSVDSIRLNMITEMPIFIPSLPEQQKIADSLTAIDERIEAQEEKIAALREHKKGLMQQLFPSL